MKRTASFVSGGTGITAGTLGQSLLAQSENVSFIELTRPCIGTKEEVHAIVQQISNAAESDGARSTIFDTIVNRDIQAILVRSSGFTIDIFATFLSSLEQELSADSSYSVGKSHSIGHNSNYMDRIEAVNFTLDDDDSARIHYYDKADLILVGVSRCGKTPTRLYMALQYDIRAADYPLTEEDMERLQLPNALEQHKYKLFGLIIDPDRLITTHNEHRPDSHYVSFVQCEFEIHRVKNLFRRENIAYVNSTHFSAEEISAKILVKRGVERHFKQSLRDQRLDTTRVPHPLPVTLRASEWNFVSSQEQSPDQVV